MSALLRTVGMSRRLGRRSRRKGERTRRPALRVVPAPRYRTGRLGFVAVAALLVAAAVFGAVMLQTLASQTSFSVQKLEARDAVLQQRVDELRLQVAQLSAPDRIATEAQLLGLQLPADVQTITVPAPRSGARRGHG